MSDATQKETFKKLVEVPDAKAEEAQKKLLEDMGNTILAINMKISDSYKNAPKYFKDALNNGVLCETAGEDAVGLWIIWEQFPIAKG